MPIAKELRICSLGEFLEFLGAQSDDSYIYRGHRRAEWPLRPCLFRARPRPPSTVNELRFVEAILLRKFKETVRLVLNVLPKDDWEWLALAQHHGLLTRLMDWTENPLVALFFAVEKTNDGDSAVWCAEPHAAAYGEWGSPFDIKEVLVVHLPHVSSRITVQKGVFTVHPIPEKPSQEWPFLLTKIVVDGSRRVAIRNDLRRLGMDRGSLFPDVDGIAQGLNSSLCIIEQDEES